MSSILKSACCLVFLAAPALPAAAQPDADTLPFGEIIDVRVINLEVVVTDGKERVHGLTSEDFRLLVDGREVPIEYFTEVLGGRAVEPTRAGAAVPALAPGEEVGTRFLVFIDEAFAIRSQRNRVLRKLVEQLPYMSPNDHMAVVAYDGQELDLLTSWTSSRPELERVFETAMERRSYGLQRRVSAADSCCFPGSPFGVPPRGALAAGPFYDAYGGWPYDAFGPLRGSLSYADLDRVLSAATSTLRGFARPPGRKVMLLLSGGWPIGSARGFEPALGYGEWGIDRALLRPLADTANRLGYTLYPVDVKGLEGLSYGSAEFGSSYEAAVAANRARNRDWSEDGTLLYLADETGGKAMLDGAGGTALRQAVEDTRSYYWLGFTPTWEENDRRHRVNVEVVRKGLEVRSRESFTDLSRQTEVSMMLESAQLFDLPLPGESRDLAVTFGEPQKGGFRKVIVPLQIEIPLDQLTLLPYEGGAAARVELRIAATDDRGTTAAIPIIPLTLENPETGDGATAAFEFSLKLRRRPHQLLISVHDPSSGLLISKRVDWTL